MEVFEENNQCCAGCLCTEEEFNLQQFAFQCEPLKAIFQVDKICLCYVCKRIAQHTVLFIQNVQSNQILLENFRGDLSQIQPVRAQVQSSISLAQNQLTSIELTGMDNDEEPWSIISSRNLKIKLEPKDEGLFHLEGEFIDGSFDFPDSYVKEEDDFPLNTLLKEEKEIQLHGVELKSLRRTLKKKKVKKKEASKIKSRIKKKLIDLTESSDTNRKIILVKKKLRSERNQRRASESSELSSNAESSKKYIVIDINEQELKRETEQRAQDQAYLNCTHKCEDCVKGFVLKDTYDRHMEKHSLSRGRFRCPFCKQRFETALKLRVHKKLHRVRYKCLECDFMRMSASAVKEHYAAKHSSNNISYKCPHCPKMYNRKTQLRKHVDYCHSGKDRVTCETCHKTYVNKDSLLAHRLRKHPSDDLADAFNNRYVCQDCGCAFKVPSQLRNHSIVHSELRAFYCVECDRSFKTASILSHHLKTAAPHINYSELPLCCEHCDKRFSIKRDLIRHMNRVHLNIKPYPCDKCDKAYINSWSLKDHQRYTHDGVKRPMKYPCSLCDKIFDRNSILKAHMRTHTGERPYQCTRCPAQFAQGSALGTHVKLVHLKLTRDGRPKPSAIK